MSQRVSPRLSLILPIKSRAGLLAASQVVLALLREMRIELDLLRGLSAPPGATPHAPGRPGTVLFVAADLPATIDDASALASFERDPRASIERAYTRRGAASVEYVLEIIW
jgi:hypothetical protein